MSGPRTLTGVPVTHGIAVAPVFVVRDAVGTARTSGSPGEERAALSTALAGAQASLETVMSGLDEDAAAILEFQSMLLEDDDLLAPILDAIDGGATADAAWSTAMNAEIEDYATAEDEVFRARASDLADLRDRVLRHLAGAGDGEVPRERCILLARDLAPSRFLGLPTDHVAGIALGEGSRTSHVSLLARARGVPLVVGLGELPDARGLAILDADTGALLLDPDENALSRAADHATAGAARADRARALVDVPAVTRSGEAVAVMANIDHPSIVEALPVTHCDGVGLTRTEFLFKDGAPSEATQVETYSRIVRWADGRPVTIRTLDAGGDKPVPGLTVNDETNPFLGMRGLRLSLAREDVFRVQLRALLRVAALGPVKIMVPMVTEPAEMVRVRALIEDVAAGLAEDGIDHAHPPVGMMIEVPAAALVADAFDADFYSIGTNDLIQYATACARDNAAVAPLARGDHPGVIRLIETVVAAGRARGVEVSVCGDMASDPRDAGILLDAGVRSLSVAPAEIGRIKASIADHGGTKP